MGGGSKQLTSLYVNKDGSNKQLNNAYANINGSSKEIFKSFLLLGNVSAGSIVKFNTTLSGTNKLTDFIVLGPSKVGDTILLLQRYSYGDGELIPFNSDGSNHYYNSEMDEYLSVNSSYTYISGYKSNYKSNLDESIRNKLVKTMIKTACIRSCIKNNNADIVNKEQRDIFLLCEKEVGFIIGASPNYDDGNSYLDVLKIATGENESYKARAFKTEAGNISGYWLRDEALNNKVNAIYYSPDGSHEECDRISIEPTDRYGIRPALSFDKSTLVDKSSFTLVSN